MKRLYNTWKIGLLGLMMLGMQAVVQAETFVVTSSEDSGPGTFSPTPTATATPTVTKTITPTGSITVTSSATTTYTISPTITSTPTISPTPTVTLTPIKSPVVTITQTSTPTVTFPPSPDIDIYEPDNTYSQASTMFLDTLQEHHSILPEYDIDWVTFNITSVPVSVVIETSGSSGDTRMWLYDSSGTNQLAYNDDSGSGLFSRITYIITQTGQYYIKIDEYGNNQVIADYQLSLRSIIASPTPTIPPEWLLSSGSLKVFNSKIGYWGNCAIRWAQPENNTTQLTIYDINGNKVITLVDNQFCLGKETHVREWDGRDTHGQRVASGIYIVYVKSGKWQAYSKIAVIK